ncbi:MAG: nuclear transport factor 2 family protein, partial [Acidobacteria bacterium]|nr:nuclear transport factor 2 family protein [Acidobacteriota bacterium]
MKVVFHSSFLGLAALVLVGCGTPEKSTDANTSAGVIKRADAAPTLDALLALEKQATADYLTSDSKSIEGMLNDKFGMREAGRQMDKAAILKLIAGNKCIVKTWALEDPLMARIDADAYVLSYRGTFDGSCTAPNGKPEMIPSPIRGATVWIRAGDKWLAAFHGQDTILDPKNPPPPTKAAAARESKKDHGSEANAKAAADRDTAAMMAVEKTAWEAWMAKDARKLDELTTADLSFQNIFGEYFANKADTLKNWTSAYCDIKSVGVTDGVGTLLSPTIGILNRTGTAEGSCNGQKLPMVPI